jgi:hypothetical protein
MKDDAALQHASRTDRDATAPRRGEPGRQIATRGYGAAGADFHSAEPCQSDAGA